MAVTDPTTNFSWDLPDVGGDDGVWDDNVTDGLNTLLNEIDTDVQTVEDEATTLASDVDDLESRIFALESGSTPPVYVSVASGPTAKFDQLILPFVAVVDPLGMHDEVAEPTRLTVPDGSDGPLSGGGQFDLGGLYRVRASVECLYHQGGDDGHSWLVELLKNGTDVIAVGRWPELNDGVSTSGENLNVQAETLDIGVPGDYYEVRVTAGQSEEQIVAASFSATRMPSPRFAVSRLIHSGGYDVHGNDAADFDRYDAVAFPADGVKWISTTGKFGGGNLNYEFVAAGRGALRSTVLAAPVAEGKASFYVASGTSGTQQEIFRVFLGATEHFRLSTGAPPDTIDVIDDSGTVATTTATISTSYHHLEVEWRLSQSLDGYLRVWVDGVLDIDLTGIDLGDSIANSEWDAYGHQAPSSLTDNFDIDDLVLQTSLGRLLGDGHRIWTVLPDADAGVNDWNSTLVDHFASVDDTDPDGDTTTVNTGTAGLREEFTFTLPSITGTIREVAVKALFRSGDTVAGTMKLGLRVDGKEALSGEITAPVDALKYNTEAIFALAGLPGGGLFTEANLANGVIVLEKGDADAIAVTQVWLEILTTS